LNATDPSGLWCLIHNDNGGCKGAGVGYNIQSWIESKQAAIGDYARLPDYVTLDVSGSTPFPVLLGGGVVTMTRDGHVFAGPQGGVGVPGALGAVRAGWIDGSGGSSNCERDSFAGGASASATGFGALWPLPVVGGIGPSVGETWGHPGDFGSRNFATEAGVGVGGLKSAAGTMSYGFHLGDLPFGW
jgi:hypothetical protein